VNCEEAVTSWKESVVHLKQHIHRKRVQTFSLNTIKEELKPSEICSMLTLAKVIKCGTRRNPKCLLWSLYI